MGYQPTTAKLHVRYYKQGKQVEFLQKAMEITTKQEKSSNYSRKHDECTSFGYNKADEVESTIIQMKRVREENTNLKKQLEQIENDYKSLQMRILDIVQQQQQPHQKSYKEKPAFTNEEENTEEPEFVSLRLGRSPREDNTTRSSSRKRGEDGGSLEDGLKLGLDCSFKSPVGDVLEVKNENKKENEAGESWPPSKSPKTVKSGDDELSQPSVKRARVSVRARCDQPTLNDGCQWRKYGQKIAKGNPCPRAYYRCTMADSCPVRKQVQRCADEMSVLVTTYEGTHNHPLPGSATAMTSFTSAAASMLLSGSSTTSLIIPPTSLPGIGGASGLNSLNPFENSRTRMSFPSFPNSQHNFPTVTLDLTTANSSICPPHFNLSSRYPSTSLNFSSPESNMLPSIWNSGYQNYGTQQQAFASLNFPRPAQEASYQPYMETIKNHASSNTQHALVETLTQAINNDPSVRSVIEKMVSSMVSGDSSDVNKCGTSFLNRSSSLSSENGSLKLQQTPLALSNSSSRSTVDNRDQTNS